MVRAAALLALLAGPASAVECRLALVLALDISSSVDSDEDRLQRQGLAAALIAPEVQQAFLATPDPVAISVFEWSGRYNQRVILDWTLVDHPQDLRQASQAIAGSLRSHDEFPTAMGYALGFGADMLRRGPACSQSTLDMAGDGENNEGFGPQLAYAEFPFSGVTVNGLVVGQIGSFQDAATLTNYYAEEVLHGAGAFLIVADGYRDYTRAMRAKLVREVMPMMLGTLPAVEGPG